MKGQGVFFAVIGTVLAVVCRATTGDAEDPSLNTTNRMVSCGAQCKFRLCNVDGDLTPIGNRIVLRDAMVAFPPLLCRKDLKLVGIQRVGEAKVAPNGKGPKKFPRISKYRPAGLKNPFPRKYFGLFNILFLDSGKGVGRKRNFGNQDVFSDDLCVLLPIRKFQVRERSRTKTVRGQFDDCVSFRTWSPRVLIDLIWASADDYDLVVIEPNGNIISSSKKTSGTGGRLITENARSCDASDLNRREEVRWLRRSKPLPGMYTVKIRHFTNCKNVLSRWELTVMTNGKYKTGKIGFSEGGNNSFVYSLTFKL